jgi:hypothetical protein
MATGYTIDGDSIRKLRSLLNWWKVQPQNVGGHDADTGQPTEVPSVTFYNASGAEVPAYGIMAITDGGALDTIPYVKAAKPSSTYRKLYAVNGPVAVADKDYGQCYATGVVRVLYDAGTPAVGELWGPTESQWYASKGSTGNGDANTTYTRADWGIVVAGIVDATNKVLLGRIVEKGLARVCRGAAKAAISGSTGTVDAVTATDDGWSPVPAATTELSVNNPWNFYLADDALCQITRNGSSWDITNVVMVDQDFEVAESVDGLDLKHTWRGVRVNPIEAVQAAVAWHTGDDCSA